MIMAAAAWFASCSQEFPADTVLPDGEVVLFTGAGPASTRTAIDLDADRGLTIAWAEADEVGIYGMSNGLPTGNNFAYVAAPAKDDPARCTFSAKDPYSMFKWINNAEQGYYAYYPYVEIKDRELDAAAHPFSLPAEQVQAGADSPAHIARYGVMTAAPVEIEASEENAGGGIRFQFANIFSIVELRFKMSAGCPVASVPVKQLELMSAAADLTVPAGTIDLTQADARQAITVEEGSRSATVNFETYPGLNKERYTSVWLVVAPGAHPAGSLRLELTAIDNSRNAFTIPEAVEFKPNRHYVREYELSIDGFVQADVFDAEIPVLECKAGEPLTVKMTGVAEKIDFWSGEEGHDYAYSDKDRMQEASMSLNFKMLLNSGTQRRPAKVKYSTDFDGTMTEAGILAATWTDVTDEFDMTTYIYGTDTKTTVGATTVPHDAGTVDCTAWFTGEGRSCCVAFFYTVEKNDPAYVDPDTGTKEKGRTYFYLHDSWVRAAYKSESSYTEIYKQTYTEGNTTDPTMPIVVLDSNFGAEDGTNPVRKFAYGGYTSVIRLGAVFKPTVDKHSWLVLPKLVRPEAKNVGKDSPIVVKGAADVQPATYEYLFTLPGTYEVAIVGTVPTLAGEKKIVKQATVTVTAE